MCLIEIRLCNLKVRKGSPNLKTEPRTSRTSGLALITEPRTSEPPQQDRTSNFEPGSFQHYSEPPKKDQKASKSGQKTAQTVPNLSQMEPQTLPNRAQMFLLVLISFYNVF